MAAVSTTGGATTTEKASHSPIESAVEGFRLQAEGRDSTYQSKSQENEHSRSGKSSFRRFDKDKTYKRKNTVLRNKPNIRPLDIGDSEEYGPDMGVLWAAYIAGSFPSIESDLSQEDFVGLIFSWASMFESSFIIEDRTESFKAGRGPVGLVMIKSDGEVIKPFPVIFTWASKRNVLRGICGFLTYVRHSSDVNLCVIYGLLEENDILERQRRYGHKLWHIGNGVWGIVGRKKNPRR